MRLHALSANLGRLQEFRVDGARETLLVHLLPDGYYVVLCLEPSALASVARFHLQRIGRELAKEI